MNNSILLRMITTSSNSTLAQTSSSWSISNTLTTISIIITVLGAVVALYQWYVSNKIKKAEFLHQINEKLRSDEIMVKAFYEIEYGHKWYDESFHNGKNGWEPKIDRLFMFLNYICYLRAQKIISENEFSILRYCVERVCSSVEAQSYLWNLYHFSKSQGSMLSFKNLLEYAFENDLVPNEFKSEKCEYYVKRLHF